MKIKEHLILRQVGGKYIVIEPGTEVIDMTYVYILNYTAVWLWTKLKDTDFKATTIVDLLIKEFDIEFESAQNAAVQFINTLTTYDLLETYNNQIHG